MSSKANLLAGQRPTHIYRNRVSRFFFQELDKGFESPYLILFSGAMVSYLVWRWFEIYIGPRQERLQYQLPVQRVPLSRSHNVIWGIGEQVRPGGDGDRSAVGVADMVGTGRYYPESDTAAAEEELRQPQLVYSEPSELHERPSARNPQGEVDVLCLELPEFDRTLRDDVYYRSVHYVPYEAAAGAAGSKGTDKEKDGHEDRITNLPIVGDPSKSETYLERMPEGKGVETVHGITKCKALTMENNCIPYAGHLESEVGRKLMLTLGPVHALRDAAKQTMPLRFTYVKQIPVNTLVLGLHSGETSRWLSSAFPNFKVHVVEEDGTLVRICRRFLGFRESSNLSVNVRDPVQFVRETAAVFNAQMKEKDKKYELVLVDAVDGAGRLSTQYGRLEFANNLRTCLANNGCVAVTIPNRDGRFLYSVTQNWRMAFSGRPVILVHCVTTPYSILITFQDTPDRGKASIGSVANVDEYRDLLRAHLSHYGASRTQFDLTSEVSAKNFCVLQPGRVYEMADYLPQHHPDAIGALQPSNRAASGGVKAVWKSWFGGAGGQSSAGGDAADARSRRTP